MHLNDISADLLPGSAIHLLPILPLALLVADVPSSNLALWGLLITTAAGLIRGFLDARRQAEQHAYDIRLRELQAADVKSDLIRHRAETAAQIAENTELTRAALAQLATK
jgi:hypothetical protein